MSDAVTRALFADDGPTETGLLAAAAAVVKSRGADRAAAATLTRAGWTSPLTRAPAQHTMSDLPGVTSSPTASGDVPAEIARRVRERQRGTVAMIAAVSTDLPTGERPWIPAPPAPPTTAGAAQTAEFAELPSATITVDGGGFVTPAAVGHAVNISWQVATVQDAILEIAHERALFNVGQWVVSRLVTAAGAAVPTVLGAIAAIEAAGWQPDLILTPLSRLDRVSAALGAMGPAALDGAKIVIGPVGSRILVASRAGLDFRISDRAQATVAEPSIGGFEISSVFWATAAIGANAVKQVTA